MAVRNAVIVGAAVAAGLGYVARRSAPRAGQLADFRSRDGQQQYEAAYDAVLEQWPAPYGDMMVPTPFGDTHVLVSGHEQAAPVVLLHATGTSATGWRSNVGSLSQCHRVFAVDIVGEAGRSRQTALLRNRQDCVTWLCAVLDGLRLDRVSIVGWSFGGWTATAFVLAEPARVDKCVLLAPFASLAPYAPPVLLFLKLGPYLPFGPPGSLALRMMSPGFRFDERFARQFVLGGRQFRAADPRRSVFPQPYDDIELRWISVPVLLLIGDRESTFDPRLAVSRAKALIPDVRARLLPGVGHMVAIEAADFVNAETLRFLEG
jgi:pimeloyl-ACP methyl ester carboxylesterase